MNIDDLVAAAASATGMTEEMVRRSAEARAESEGITIEEVLSKWAGIGPDGKPIPNQFGDESEGDDEPTETDEPAAEEPPPSEEPSPSEEPPPTPAAEPSVETPKAAAPEGMTREDLLAAAASASGMSEKMAERSAGARAKSEGTTTEAVLADWAGVELPEELAAAAPAEAAPAVAAEAGGPAAEADSEEAPAAGDIDVEVLGETPPPPVDEVEEPEEPSLLGAVPRWLAALFVAVPLFGVAYIGFLPNGPNCGDAGRLAVDPVTGVAVNCDGSEYGSDAGADFFTIGEEIYTSLGCTACHGPGGAGSGNFPAFTGGALLTTFPTGSCSDHKEWVTLGTAGWPDATYGAANKPVGGSGSNMPGFGFALDEAQLAAVAIYERVAFGGEDLDTALRDCAPSPTATEAQEG
jgi:mono/diheme cytochrome c family protein